MQWYQESCDIRDDPVSGARIIQLTSAAAISNNIYGEIPPASPDGSRIVIVRHSDFHFDVSGSLLVFELNKLGIVKVDETMGVRAVSMGSWGENVFYHPRNGLLTRLNISTLEKKDIITYDPTDTPPFRGAVSPDGRYLVYLAKRLKGPGSPVFQINRIELDKGIVETIFEHPEISNPHLQFNPVTGADIMVQNNRGIRMEKDGTVGLPSTDTREGTTLFLIDKDGKNVRYLPAGPPITNSITGHECFIANTGKILFSSSWNRENWSFDDRFPEGNLFIARPGEEKPEMICCPEHRFNHISISKCGRYFLADSHGDKGLFSGGQLNPVSLVIGNIESGKYKTIVKDTMAQSGGNQSTHTHPYLTADNKYVIFNANPYYGVPQVFAARIQDGFLGSLD